MELSTILILTVAIVSLIMAITSVVLHHIKPKPRIFENAPLGGVFAPVVAASDRSVNWKALPKRLDGVLLQFHDRVLVKDQERATENGIYEVQNVRCWERASDMQQVSQLSEGNLVFVRNGNRNRQSTFSLRLMHTLSETKEPKMGDIDILFFSMFEHLFGTSQIPEHSLLQVDHNVPQKLVWRSPENIEEQLLQHASSRTDLIRHGAFVEQNTTITESQKNIPNRLHHLTLVEPLQNTSHYERWKQSHKHFETYLWDLPTSTAYLEQTCPEQIPLFQKATLEEQENLMRAVLLYHEGGWCADLKCRLVNPEVPLDALWEDQKCPRLLLFQHEGTLVNALVGSTAKHPFWREVLDTRLPPTTPILSQVSDFVDSSVLEMSDWVTIEVGPE